MIYANTASLWSSKQNKKYEFIYSFFLHYPVNTKHLFSIACRGTVHKKVVLKLFLKMRGKSFLNGDTLVDDLNEAGVLQGSGYPLFVSQLFVDSQLWGVSAGWHLYFHLNNKLITPSTSCYWLQQTSINLKPRYCSQT